MNGFFLMQVVADKSTVNLLIIGIGGLVGAISILALYIKKLHSKHMAQTQKFTEAMLQGTASQENVKEAVDRMTVVVTDLHKFIIQALQRRRQ